MDTTIIIEVLAVATTACGIVYGLVQGRKARAIVRLAQKLAEVCSVYCITRPDGYTPTEKEQLANAVIEFLSAVEAAGVEIQQPGTGA
jgi:hypothetical protein